MKISMHSIDLFNYKERNELIKFYQRKRSISFYCNKKDCLLFWYWLVYCFERWMQSVFDAILNQVVQPTGLASKDLSYFITLWNLIMKAVLALVVFAGTSFTSRIELIVKMGRCNGTNRIGYFWHFLCTDFSAK